MQLTEIERKIIATIAFEESNRIHAFDIEPNYFESPDAREMFQTVIENIQLNDTEMFLMLNNCLHQLLSLYILPL